MDNKNRKLYKANSDILYIVKSVKSIGWNSIRQPTIQRIVYLSKVLHSFVIDGQNNIFKEYHFTSSVSGPYSELVFNSIINLKSNEHLVETDGQLYYVNNSLIDEESDRNRLNWFKTVVYILGLYGEDKVFGFTINDPLYKDSIERNEPKELDISPDNVTIQVLKQFKYSFEETLTDTKEIDNKEYLELYFEYVFSKIIKKES